MNNQHSALNVYGFYMNHIYNIFHVLIIFKLLVFNEFDCRPAISS